MNDIFNIAQQQMDNDYNQARFNLNHYQERYGQVNGFVEWFKGCELCSGSCVAVCSNNCKRSCSGSCKGSCSGSCDHGCSSTSSFW